MSSSITPAAIITPAVRLPSLGHFLVPGNASTYAKAMANSTISAYSNAVNSNYNKMALFGVLALIAAVGTYVASQIQPQPQRRAAAQPQGAQPKQYDWKLYIAAGATTLATVAAAVFAIKLGLSVSKLQREILVDIAARAAYDKL